MTFKEFFSKWNGMRKQCDFMGETYARNLFQEMLEDFTEVQKENRKEKKES